MARRPIDSWGRVKGGPARGGLGRELRFYSDEDVTVPKAVFRRSTGVGAQPVVIIPNAGIPRALAADRAAGDTFVTVAIGQTGLYNVGDYVPIWNGANTVYRVITAITPGTGRLDLDLALGVAFTVAAGTMVNATDMEGHIHGWVDDDTDLWLQVTELGSNRRLPPQALPTRAPVSPINVYDEGALIANRPTINLIGDPVSSVDNGGLNRVDITIIGRFTGGSEAAPGVHATVDTDTGLWWETSNIVSIVGLGKRVAQFTGTSASAVNYVAFSNTLTGVAPIIAAAGADASIDLHLRAKAGFRVAIGSNLTDYPTGLGGTGNATLEAQGGSANVELFLKGKGTFGTIIANNYTDFWWMQGGSGVISATAAGGTANVDISLIPKGSGVVRLGGGSTDYLTAVGGSGTVTLGAAGGTASVSINATPKGTAGTLQYLGNPMLGVVGRDASDTGPANTVAETDLWRQTIAANLLGATGGFFFVVAGQGLCNSGGGTTTFTWRVKLGATTVVTHALGFVTDVNVFTWRIEGWMVQSATGAQRWIIRAMTTGQNSNDEKGASASQATYYNTSAEDTTAAKDLIATGQLQTASATITLTEKLAAVVFFR